MIKTEKSTSVTDNFEKAWRDGVPEIDDYIPDEDIDIELLRQLVCLDIEYRWGKVHELEDASLARTVDFYTKKYPELLGSEIPSDLIIAEYLARREAGDNVSIHDYRDKYPEAYRELSEYLNNESKRDKTRDTTVEPVDAVNVLGNLVSGSAHLLSGELHDSDGKRPDQANIDVYGATLIAVNRGPDRSVVLAVEKPKRRTTIFVYATTAKEFGLKSVRLSPTEPHSDFGDITLLPFELRAIGTFLFIQFARCAHLLYGRMRYVMPILFVTCFLALEFRMVPSSLRNTMKHKSLHLINTHYNSIYETDDIPDEIEDGQTVTLTADSPVKHVDDWIVIPSTAKMIISPGVELRMSESAGIRCNGSIAAMGAEDSPVIFTEAQEGAGWKHVALTRCGGDKSEFRHCVFSYGRGDNYLTPHPLNARDEVTFQKIESRFSQDDDHYSIGGAVLAYDATAVLFEDCIFRNNSSTMGGAVYVRNNTDARFERCRFIGNIAGGAEKSLAGGGAVFVQSSYVNFVDNCTFVGNVAHDKYSCGGAVYVGFLGNAQFDRTDFSRNEASNAGGALYCLNMKPSYRNATTRTINVSGTRFFGNLGSVGSAIYIDQGVAMSVNDCTFVGNRCGAKQWPQEAAIGPSGTRIGTIVVNSDRADNMSRLSIDEFSYFRQNNCCCVGERFTKDANLFRDCIEDGEVSANLGDMSGIVVDSPLRIVQSMLKQNEGEKRCYKDMESRRAIDTVVIHHISALNWFSKDFHDEYKDALEEIEKMVGVTPDNIQENKYDWRLCKEILRSYGVSSHYLIDREGIVYQLVEDNDIAFHAGKSEMPDGREGVNDFSIGIELISSHPDDDPEIQPENAYTENQYQSLNRLVSILNARFDVKYVVGHDEVAPSRKKDPGRHFQWKNVRNGDLSPRQNEWGQVVRDE